MPRTTKTTTTRQKKAKIKIKYPIARLCLRANFNNSIVTLTDLQGKVLCWSSSGKSGFKGSKKSTPFASQKATEEVLTNAKNYEVSTLHIEITGAGMGRDSFIRAIQASGLQVESIKDKTSFAFGGVTLKKRRRV
jgi:small subunit ribosomal protein S11